MAESVSGAARTSSVPGFVGLDSTRDAVISLSFRQLTTANERALAVGSNATSPATFAGLNGAVQNPLADTAPIRITDHPGGGGLDVSVQLALTSGTLGTMVTGEHVWACLFAVDPAISGSVPDLVVDLGILS